MADALPDRTDLPDNADFVSQCIGKLDEGRIRRDPRSPAEMRDLLYRLFTAGRHDIALGRLFEGHVDAWQILHRYGTDDQIETLGETSRNKPLLGVWNAEGPDHHLSCSDSGISGGKSYASGAGIVTHALVTTQAGTPQVQLHLVDLHRDPGRIDTDWWQVAGMQGSQTHRVRWDGAAGIGIGAPGDYEREPWFSTGALRFACVQAGGLAGLRDAVRDHLVRLDRHRDPVQQRRLAALHGWASAATGVVLSAGSRGLGAPDGTDPAVIANVRNVVYACCEEGIALAQRACGTAAYFSAHPVCRFAQDLGMYIRQPGPDAQLAKAGAAVADGTLDVWPCGP